MYSLFVKLQINFTETKIYKQYFDFNYKLQEIWTSNECLGIRICLHIGMCLHMTSTYVIAGVAL